MNYINKKYLNKTVVTALRDKFLSQKPYEYLVIDDFINPIVFEEMSQAVEKYEVIDERTEAFMNNKTVFIRGEKFRKFYDFFESDFFIQYLQFLYGKKFERHMSGKMNQIEQQIGKGTGGIAQVYEQGDYMSWHTDISKDMKREELVEKGGYELWDKYHVERYEEIGAFTYYLYNSDDKNWDNSYGGNLELGRHVSGDMESFACITPKQNRLVLIKSSNSSYHRVTKVLKDERRLSFQDLLINYNNNNEGSGHIHNGSL